MVIVSSGYNVVSWLSGQCQPKMFLCTEIHKVFMDALGSVYVWQMFKSWNSQRQMQ